MAYSFAGITDSAGVPLFLSPYVPNLGKLWCLKDELDWMAEKVAQLSALPMAAKLASDLRWNLQCAYESLGEVEWTPDPSLYEFWERPDTGERYSVRLLDGDVTGVVGPFRDELSDVRDLFEPNYDLPRYQALMLWAIKHRGEFRVVAEDEIMTCDFEHGAPVWMAA